MYIRKSETSPQLAVNTTTLKILQFINIIHVKIRIFISHNVEPHSNKTQYHSRAPRLWNALSDKVKSWRPPIKYVTLFLMIFDPPSHCHKLSQILEPPLKVCHTSSGGARAGRARAPALAGVCSALALALAWSLNFQIAKKHQFML